MLRFFRLLSIIIVSIIAVTGLTKEYFSKGTISNIDLFALIATFLLLVVSILTELYQYKDQKRIEKETEERFKHINLSINKPLFPFSIIYCLKFRGNKETIKEYFQHHIDGYVKLKKMSPPNSKVFTPALLEFPFDEDTQNSDFVVGMLTESERKKAILSSGYFDKDDIYLTLQGLKIEFYKPDKSQNYSDTPDLKLNTVRDPKSKIDLNKIFDIRLYNENLYQAHIIDEFIVEYNNNKILNVVDLAGCKWNVSLEFIIHDQIHYEIKPKLTHLELRFGKSPRSSIELTQKALDTGLITKNKNFNINTDGLLKNVSWLSIDHSFQFPIEDFDEFVKQKN